MKKIITTLFLLTLCITISSCKEKVKESKDMKTTFAWDFTIAAPIHYPIQAQYATITYGADYESFDVMTLNPQSGIGYPTGSNFLPDYYGEGIELPNGLHILWASFADRKYYKADIKFSEELRKKMLMLFREGYITSFDGKQRNYSNIVATILPGGNIWLYVNDYLSRKILVCDTLKGTEVKLKPRKSEFEEDPGDPFENLETASVIAMKDNFHSDEILKKYGCSDTIWNNYKRRYDYKIKIDFENKQTSFIPKTYSVIYANGELLHMNDKGFVPKPSVPKNLECQWTADKNLYTGYFYFDEQEIIYAFKKIFGSSSNEKGNLIIKVSKYNNWFDIYLQVGDREYRIVNTKIHVFKQGIHEDDEKAVVIYNNHSDIYSEDISFIGE